LAEKTDHTPHWISGKHSSIAIRLTHHPIARELCIQSKTALISTSANASGENPPRNTIILRRNFRGIVDYIVPGECFKNTPASTIKILKTGKILRP
jgi:L-threonylcarbamoyladenylate synthase